MLAEGPGPVKGVLRRAPVGDRYVTEEMRATGAAFGAEPSGHVVMERSDLVAGERVLIGDALVAGVRVLQAAARLGVAAMPP